MQHCELCGMDNHSRIYAHSFEVHVILLNFEYQYLQRYYQVQEKYTFPKDLMRFLHMCPSPSETAEALFAVIDGKLSEMLKV